MFRTCFYFSIKEFNRVIFTFPFVRQSSTLLIKTTKTSSKENLKPDPSKIETGSKKRDYNTSQKKSGRCKPDFSPQYLQFYSLINLIDALFIPGDDASKIIVPAFDIVCTIAVN